MTVETIIPVEPITITVNGTMNSGKSTIAFIVAETLLKAGFKVALHDEYHADGWGNRSQDRVEQLMKRGLTISVKTENRPRQK